MTKVPTPTVERMLLEQMSEVHAGYFASLCDQGRNENAFRVIERARGRIEAEALRHHELVEPHEPTPAEQQLASLNLQLIKTDNETERGRTVQAIYDAEQQLGPKATTSRFSTEPVDLKEMQKDLLPSELILEYVLDEPNSYVLAINNLSIHRYTLKAKAELEREAASYRSEVVHRKADLVLAQQLFADLLGQIPEYKQKQNIIVVPDGKLHLLPYAALYDNGQYILTSHLVTVAPSGTVLHLLRHPKQSATQVNLPYLGVAAWTTGPTPKTLFASIFRSASGPQRSELVALPESRHEVESIAANLPKPSTILLGAAATETQFKQLPLSQYNVLHLALHAYADVEYPDRSALVFAPMVHGPDDGLLQVREIRDLRLNADLVTLSACNTGVGPVGEAGVANIVNAFIEAGATTVVSTLWQVEDHATSQLMTHFYEHLGRHEEKAQALRQAQLEMLTSGAPPSDWAGFEVVGDPRGSLFERSDTSSPSRSGR